eukprot:scaffold11515_cov72-Attheya_sp.AAC.2
MMTSTMDRKFPTSSRREQSRQELTQSKTWKINYKRFYCIEAWDNKDDRTMTIKDLQFDLLPHARNKPAQGSMYTQWSNY